MSDGAGALIGRLTRYGTVGVLVNLGAYLCFLLLLWVGVLPLAASAIIYVAAVATSYLLNRAWSFNSTATHRKDLPRYLLAYGVGLLVTMAAMAVLLQWLPPAIAQLFVIGITAVAIFACLEVLKFGREG